MFHVRFGSKADIIRRLIHVRFASESGYRLTHLRLHVVDWEQSFVAGLLDHLGITDNTLCVAPLVGAGLAPFAWTDRRTIA
jgi:hypothetical protein